MTYRFSLMLGLAAGAMASSLAAQPAPTPAGPPTPPAADRVEDLPKAGDPASPAGRTMEFRGADGKPLPPAIQQLLRERFKNGPPPTIRTIPSGSASDAKDEVVVTGAKPRGSVIGDIPPERSLNPMDIRAYGASSIEELLQALGPQVSSGRGRSNDGPIVLVNGKRVSGFAEIAKIPPEAIQKMEVFPEELALKYGYPADQKVVNFILYERYGSRVGQLAGGAATDGGREMLAASAGYLRIRGDTRMTADAEYSRAGSLRESERNVQPLAGTPDQARFRTLSPANERVVLNGTISAPLLSGVSGTFNARWEATGGRSLLGLGPVGPLARDIDTDRLQLGTAMGGPIGKWSWSATGNYDRIATETWTDTTGAPGARDRARSVASLAKADLVLTGATASLPAGPILASVRGSLEARDFASRSQRGALGQSADLDRDKASFQANVDVPIAGRAGGGLRGLGTLSVNGNLEVEELSDFGTLRTWGYGLNWSPSEAISLIASVTDEAGAPSVEQLGAPVIVTPNVRTYDFVRGEAVDITRTFGGNPNLRADDRHVFRLGLNAKPFARTDLTFSFDYTSTRVDDPIAPFPVATSQIEAAFPERFARDAAGRLLSIDGRPLNFARAAQDKVRWGVNFARRLGSAPPGMENAKVRFTGPVSETELQRRFPGAQIMRVEAGSPAARQFDGLSSRLFLNLYHSWYLKDETLVRPGGPVLDLLDGAALNNRGGRPRHEVEFQAGAFQRGLGGRITATWLSGTTVSGLPAGAGATAGDLRFADVATVNATLFVNMTDRMGGPKAPAWAKGMRISLGVNNLFDSRPSVRDANGSTPLAYQPAYLDPLGRTVTLSVRKVF